MLNANDYADGKDKVMRAIANAYHWPGYPHGTWFDRILDLLHRARPFVGVREGVLALIIGALAVTLVIRWRQRRRKSAAVAG
jgi:hypothetical protein